MKTSGLRPADPHVTGDGNGDASDEVIAAEMAMEEIDTFGPPEDEDALAGIITKAIARGRELGARDENAECEAVARERLEHWRENCKDNIAAGCAPPQYNMGGRAEASIILKRIEARRAGMGTK